MKVLVVKFDLNKMRFITMIEEFEKDSRSNLKDYYRIIGCDSIDITNYSKDIAIVVDDEGLLKSANPVLEIAVDRNYYGNTIQLAGTLVFAKNHYGEDGISLVGLTEEEILLLLRSLKMRAIGISN